MIFMLLLLHHEAGDAEKRRFEVHTIESRRRRRRVSSRDTMSCRAVVYGSQTANMISQHGLCRGSLSVNASLRFQAKLSRPASINLRSFGPICSWLM